MVATNADCILVDLHAVTPPLQLAAEQVWPLPPPPPFECGMEPLQGGGVGEVDSMRAATMMTGDGWEQPGDCVRTAAD